MMKLFSILRVYFQNRTFRILSILVIISALVSKYYFIYGTYYYFEELATMLFITVLMLLFYTGLMLKWQFATPRAALLPGYRWLHALVFIGIYAMFVILAYCWFKGIYPAFPISEHALSGLYWLIFCVSLFIIYTGYVSVMRVICWAYVVLLLAATGVSAIISLLDNYASLNEVIIFVCVGFVLFFLVRLFRLNEDCWEFPYLFSWPPKRYLLNQMKGVSPGSPWMQKIMTRQNKHVNPYPRQSGDFAKAWHWDYFHNRELFTTLCFILLLSAALPSINNVTFVVDFFEPMPNNFMLFTLFPVILTIGDAYKKLVFWGYDLIKPVEREAYIKQRGIKLGAHLVVYWLSAVVFIGIMPSILVYPDELGKASFWMFVLLTGVFSIFVAAYIFWAASLKNTWGTLVTGVLVGLCILLMLFASPRLTLFPMIQLIGVYALCGCALVRWGYLAWCDKEYL